MKEKKQLKVGLLESATHVEECLKENTQVACIPPPCSPLQLFSTLQPFSSSRGWKKLSSVWLFHGHHLHPHHLLPKEVSTKTEKRLTHFWPHLFFWVATEEEGRQQWISLMLFCYQHFVYSSNEIRGIPNSPKSYLSHIALLHKYNVQ